MSKINVTGRMRSFNPDAEETFYNFYDNEGNLTEYRFVTAETDYFSGSYTRVSSDNGRTWSEWVTNYNDDKGRHGKVEGSTEGDEYIDGCILGQNMSVNDGNQGAWFYTIGGAPTLYHEQSGCYVCTGSSQYYLKGREGYSDYWEKGEDNIRTHAYFAFRRHDGTEVKRMFTFEEDGTDYDPANPRSPSFLEKNRCMAEKVKILPDGDLCVVLWVNMRLCCKLSGVDVNTYFPSCPDFQFGMILARGHWNPETEDFDFTYSNPIMISDLQSSRGLLEPQITVLKNGRWLLVFRGSNFIHEPWNTRISPAAPSFKWYSYSDDGGKTFTPVMPWHFDTREVVYSPASISSFFRSKKNGKLYWIGNVYDDPCEIYANRPRHTLQICEVDDTNGHLIKDTLTVIETLRDGQTYVELSNFGLLENRETLALELCVTKININGKEYGRTETGEWYSEAWKYTISFE